MIFFLGMACVINKKRREPPETTRKDSSPLLSTQDLDPGFWKGWPKRSVADFLVDMFLGEINRIYEMIHPSSFLSRYAIWWASHEDGNTQSDEHLDFGLLILRLGLLSLQSLPHPKYPASKVLNTSPESLERRLYALANNAQQHRRSRLARRRSLTFIQCGFYHVCYLKNKAEIRESWHVLSETVNDAHELGLHLKDPGAPLSDLEMELRRRTFWNLYVWNR